MNFINPNRTGRNSFPFFLLTLLIVLLAFGFIGQLPMMATYFLSEVRSIDVVDSISINHGHTLTLLLLVLPFTIGLLAFFLCVKYIHQWKIKTLFTGNEAFRFKRMFTAFGVWFILSLLLFYFQKTEEIIFQFDPTQFFGLLFVTIVFMSIQVIFEEVLFRGFLMQWIGRSGAKSWIVVIITGVLFGLMHMGNPEVKMLGNVVAIYYIVSGIFLGLLTWLDNGLELPIGYHLATNFFASLIVTNDWQAFQTDALFIDKSPAHFNISDMLILFSTQAVFFLIFFGRKKWFKRDEKLN